MPSNVIIVKEGPKSLTRRSNLWDYKAGVLASAKMGQSLKLINNYILALKLLSGAVYAFCTILCSLHEIRHMNDEI